MKPREKGSRHQPDNGQSIDALEVLIAGGQRKSVLTRGGSDPEVVIWDHLSFYPKRIADASIVPGCLPVAKEDADGVRESLYSCVCFFPRIRFLSAKVQLSKRDRGNKHFPHRSNKLGDHDVTPQ